MVRALLSPLLLLFCVHWIPPFKAEAGKKNIPHRDEQFKKIEVLKQQYYDQGNPVMSMDVKKKELIGNFFRSGKLYTTETLRVNDHAKHGAARS